MFGSLCLDVKSDSALKQWKTGPFFVSVALAFSVPASAFMNAPNYGQGNAFSTTWSGSGDIILSGPTLCTLATTNRKNDPATNYTTRGVVDGGLGAANNLFLLTSGTDALPFIVVFEDTSTATQHTLTYNVASGLNAGGTRQANTDCGNFTPNSNSRVIITVPESSLYGYPGLAGAANGTYNADLRITNQNTTTGETADRAFNVRIIKNTAQVRINGLDPLNFDALTPGTGADAVLDDGFCVHASTGSYSIQASGGAPGDGANGSFGMVGAGTSDKLEYTVQYDDSGTFVSAAANLVNGILENNSGAGFPGNTVDDSCSGGENASLRVTIPSQEIDEAQPDSYSDTLVITVAPI